MAKEEGRDARRHREGRRRPWTIENANATSGQRGREPARHVSRQFPVKYFYVGISYFDVGFVVLIVSPAHIRPVPQGGAGQVIQMIDETRFLPHVARDVF